MLKAIFQHDNQMFTMTAYGDVWYKDIRVAFREMHGFWYLTDEGVKYFKNRPIFPSHSMLDYYFNLVKPKKYFTGVIFSMLNQQFVMGQTGTAFETPIKESRFTITHPSNGGWYLNYGGRFDLNLSRMALQKPAENDQEVLDLFAHHKLSGGKYSSDARYLQNLTYACQSTINKLNDTFHKAQTDYYKTLDRITFKIRNGGATFVMLSNGVVLTETEDGLIFHSQKDGNSSQWKHFDSNNRLTHIKRKYNQVFQAMYDGCFL